MTGGTFNFPGNASGTVRQTLFDSADPNDGHSGNAGIMFFVRNMLATGTVFIASSDKHVNGAVPIGPQDDRDFVVGGGGTFKVQAWGDGSNAAQINFGILG
jgi:hypothetical protein